MKKWISCLMLLLACKLALAGDSATIVTYPLPAIYQQSSVFTLTVGGKVVPVVSYNDKYDYAHCSMSAGITEIEITLPAKESITSFNISPKKNEITGLADGNKLRFTLHKDAYLIVKINKFRELVIAIDSIETNKPAAKGKNIFNITTAKYKADASGKSIATNAIQAAIDDAAAYKGANPVVYIPAGVYATGNIRLRSNVSLYLEGGAVLLFTGKRGDYFFKSHKASQKRDVTWWLYTDSGTHNIKIYGRGTLDGNGKYAVEKSNIGNNILAVLHSSNIVLDGLIIRNAAAWAIIPVRSHDLTFRNFKLFNRFDMGENDGIDVMESTNVRVQHAIGIALDDPFSAKTWTQQTDLARNWPGHPLPQDNILFEDLVSWTYCYAYKIGQGVMQPQRNIIFRDCVVYDAAVGIGVHHKWGTSYISNVTFENIDIEKLSYQNDDNRCWGAFFMQNGDKKGSGPVSNVIVKNIRVRENNTSRGKLKGINDTTAVSNFIFENIIMPSSNKPAASLQQMQLTDTTFCKNILVL